MRTGVITLILTAGLLTPLLRAETIAPEDQVVGGRNFVRLDSLREHFGFQTMERVGSKFFMKSDLHRLEGEIYSRGFLVDDVKFVLSEPLVRQNDEVLVWRPDLKGLIEPALKLPELKRDYMLTTVVLDAGHGGHDIGARSELGVEKAFALDTAKRAKALLKAQGFQVVMTRSTDRFIPLAARVAFANRFEKAILVSIHFNSGDHKSTGIETFRLTPPGLPSTVDKPTPRDAEQRIGNMNDPENLLLAHSLHRALSNNSGLPDRGIKQARFHVIKNARIPAVLLEGGFVSNLDEARLLASPAYRQTLALAIAQGVSQYRTTLQAETIAKREAPYRVLARQHANSAEAAETGVSH